ncbi:ATP-grasp fold amidoligase family protein [Colwelliaceae bacterium BS250]
MQIRSFLTNYIFFNKINYIYLKLSSLIISDNRFISARYEKVFGKKLNIDNPLTFNEKIQQRILNDKQDIYSNLTDKIKVREYVSEKIGKEYLVELIATYSSPHDIDFESLPNEFVFKCNHDSGSVVICNDKNTFNQKQSIKKLNYCINRNFYYITREKHYKSIKPYVMCEKFIGKEGKVPKDYKLHTFNSNGKSKIFIQCDSERYSGHKRNMFDENWVPQKFNIHVYPEQDIVEKPANLELMKYLATRLSEGFSYVRCDFFEVDGKVFFGELTFTPEAGVGKFNPAKWDTIFGEFWDGKF